LKTGDLNPVVAGRVEAGNISVEVWFTSLNLGVLRLSGG